METKEYIAFISYKREDEYWAKWLQLKLEHYRLPLSVRKENSTFPKMVRPIFRDSSDLSSGVLADDINNALESSRFLIVICSPNAAESEWVDKEIRSFMSKENIAHVIPFIVEGKPYSGNADTECFPKVLRELSSEQELLGINVMEMGREAAMIKVVAHMFELKFDSLWRRYERERRKRIVLWLSGLVSLLVASVMISLYIAQKNRELDSAAITLERLNQNLGKANQDLLLANDSLEMAKTVADRMNTSLLKANDSISSQQAIIRNVNKKLKESNWDLLEKQSRYIAEEVNRLIDDDGDYIMARRLAAMALPKDIHRPIDRPYVPELAFAFWRSVQINEGVLHGHTKTVYSLSYSSDGRLIASGSGDATIRIWDASSLLPIKTFMGHTCQVGSVSFSPQGDRLVSGSCDNTIRVWDVETNQEILRINTEEDGGSSVAFCLTGKRIVSVNHFGDLVLWDANTGEMLNGKSLKESIYADALSVSPDGNTIYLGTNSGVVYVYDAISLDLLDYLVDDEGICSVSLSPDGKRVAIGSREHNVHIRDVKTGNKLLTLVGHTGGGCYCAYSFDGKKLVTASSDHTVRIWDAEKGFLEKTISEHASSIYSLSYNPIRHQFIAGSSYYNIRVWEDSSKKVTSFPCHSSRENAIGYHPVKEDIIMGVDKNKVCIWNAKSGILIKSFAPHNQEVYSASFNTAGDQIITGSFDHTIRYWDVSKESIVKERVNESGLDYIICMSGNKKYYVSDYDKNTLAVKLLDTGTLISEIPIKRGEYRSALFCFDGQCVGTVSKDGVRIWDTSTGTLIRRITGNNGRITMAALSTDGKIVATYSSDHVLCIWDTYSGEMIESFAIQKREDPTYYSMIFSPDGQTLALGGRRAANSTGAIQYNELIDLRDVNTGVLLMRHEGDQAIYNIQFRKDGEQIMANTSNELFLWDISLQGLVEETRAKYPLSKEQRQLYYF